MMSGEEWGLRTADDALAELAYADWLDEQGRVEQAVLYRLAGRCRLAVESLLAYDPWPGSLGPVPRHRSTAWQRVYELQPWVVCLTFCKRTIKARLRVELPSLPIYPWGGGYLTLSRKVHARRPRYLRDKCRELARGAIQSEAEWDV